MTAGAPCRSCGTDLRENAKFCDECGVPTAGSADTAKYKQVTVLFADVVRSMDIAAAVELERLREVMTELVERSAVVVRRYGGTVDYTGDGVMAIFGAPVALEDHAFRGCLAALAIQEEANRMATEVQRRDGVALQLRVGLNSGRVIAGEFGSGSLGYAATGEAVGFAQRMESVAPPGGVVLSESTARLVEDTVVLAQPEWVHIKGAGDQVRVRRLMGISPRHGLAGRADARVVGRGWEMAALDAMLDRTIGGRGGVVNVVGPPGIGKSRAAREAAALAADRGVEVFWAFCESHTGDIPFHVVAQLLRAGNGVADLDAEAARARLRANMPDADPHDLLLLDDLLGNAEPDAERPQIDSDARRRRLTALINATWLARTQPALFIIEDAHWIDAVSESMLADFLVVIPRTPSMVLVTSRPEYRGVLMRAPDAQTIALAALDDSDTAALLGELLGSDPSVLKASAAIADRAAGNPFFAEEMVRELVQRGVLSGERGDYVCRVDIAELSVPATVQAAITARIDRLGTSARRTLNAASVIGARFAAELLTALGIDPVVDELVNTELIDQVRFTPRAEYAFHHPLIRAVVYESQLKSDRAEWHRRLAAAVQEAEPGSLDENAALIAEHLQAAGELHAAYGWHMRAGAWSADRDIDAARVSWDRARRIADGLAVDDAARSPLRIPPRTMLCATDYQRRAIAESQGRFEELRALCNAVGDKVSLAIGMSGLITELFYDGRIREGARLASEQMALLESVGDPALTMGLSFIAFATWFEAGELGEISRWSQTVVDLAGGDPARGAGFGVGSPLAIALTFRGMVGSWAGSPGWRDDLDDAVGMARRSSQPAHLRAAAFAASATWAYGFSIQNGVLRAEDSMVRAIEEALQAAEASSNDVALSLAQYGLGIALLSRTTAGERRRGLDMMMRARDTWLRRQVALQDVGVADMYIALETSGRGDREAAIPVLRKVVDDLYEEDRLGYGVWATRVLVETLLERGGEDDVAEAQTAIDRLVGLRADQVSALREVTLLMLRALLARTRGDDVVFRELANRYRAMAESLGYDGHVEWAAEMIKGAR